MLGFLSPISSLGALYLTPAVTRAVRGQGERGERGATLDNIRLWPADRVLSGIYRNMNR